MRTVAVVFDDSQRPDTTGIYCQRALERLGRDNGFRVIHVAPEDLQQGPPSIQANLWLFVDDGLDYSIPEQCQNTAWWAIDTHLGFDRTFAKARSADLVFAAQMPGAVAFRAAGVSTATWLPLACDEEIQGRQEVRKRYDACFVGNMTSQRREGLVRLLREAIPITYVGRQWFQAMARTYSASKVVFNCSTLDDLNMRVFEGLCSGALVLTDSLSNAGQEELFQNGVHLATYTSDEAMVDQLRRYLKNDDLRQRVAERGRQEVLARHTYRHRMETILTACWGPKRTWSRTSVSIPGLPSKDSSYYEWDRPDVLALIPASARRVLDVGCGSGRLGASIKQRQAAEVTGVEIDATAAERAKQRLDRVFVSSIDSAEAPFERSEFDCIVCADILEHLASPASVLERLRSCLAPEGQLVFSIPNARNHTVIRSLMHGNWTYEPAGLLDETHLRFFTRREIEKLLFRAGFQLDELKMVPGEGHREWLKNGRPTQLAFGDVTLNTSSPVEAEEFFAYQYLGRASLKPVPDRGLTSIILVTHNQVGYTKACLESIRFRTDEPYELIIVDNASTDGTRGYLASLGDAQVILNDDNRGFPAAVNQGLAIARGQNILLLNNDTLATTGWLRRMLDAFHTAPDVGLVGPVSNSVSGEQQIEVSYRRLEDLDGFAWDWSKTHRDERKAVSRLVGFCLLIKREVLDRIGGLDERFGIGNFEDDDFCRRALAAGYRAVIARDSFVHHFGSASFRGNGVDLRELLQKNQVLYEQKWNPEKPSHHFPQKVQADVKSPSASEAIPNGLADNEPVTASDHKASAEQPQLSACLIVRDNEGTIEACLRSIRPWVDEIVVIDTGSTDRTPEICRELGARVHEWAWRDDFAAARNVSLEHARGRWIFWMDSDDTIPEECGRKLRALADREHPETIQGFVMQVHCPGGSPQETTVVDHIKLIRNRPEIRFEFRIHEQVLPSIRRLGGEVSWTDLYVVHSGSDRSEAGRERKLARDFRLLHKELEDRGRHPFLLFNLGMTCADADQEDKAIGYLRECIEVSHPQESHVRKAYSILVGCLQTTGRTDEAVATCEQGLEHFPSDKELLFRLAVLHQHLGELQSAESLYDRVLNETTERHFTSVDIGILGVKARHNLALLLESKGDFPRAAREWRTIAASHPTYRIAWRRLGDLCCRFRWADEFQQIQQQLERNPSLRPLGVLLKGLALESTGDLAAGLEVLEAGLREFPDDSDLLNECCRALFGSPHVDRAEAMLTRLTERSPDDASAFLNLGAVQQRKGLHQEARSSLTRSLQLRPEYGPALDLLAVVDECLATAGTASR